MTRWLRATGAVMALILASAVAPALAQAPAAGSASEFYMQYRKAFDSAKRIEDLLPYMSASRRKEIESTPPDERAKMFELVKIFGAITGVKVIKEARTANGATLSVEALDPDKAKTVGTIEILREGNAWKVDQESWKSS